MTIFYQRNEIHKSDTFFKYNNTAKNKTFCRRMINQAYLDKLRFLQVELFWYKKLLNN